MRHIILLLIGLVAAAAAPLDIELGKRLHYHRLQSLPADLPPTDAARRQACVLDLRFVPADAGEAAAVQRWFKLGARPDTPVFVLVNSETSGELLRILNELYPTRGVLTIGVALPLFEPDVIMKVSPEDERRAYDALADGIPVADILSDNPGKARNDETSLSRDRPAGAPADLPGEQAGNERPRPPIDAALQRAVHLHRSLIALKRL